MPSATSGQAPDLEKYLKSFRGQPLEAAVENLISLLKRRQIRGSEPCAVATAHILLQVVARSKWHDVDGLIDNVSRIGRRLVEAQPRELVIGNIVRRILALIRDEAVEDRNEAASETPSEAPMSPSPLHPDPTRVLQSPPLSTNTKQDLSGGGMSDAGVPTSRPGPMSSYSSVNVPKSLFHLLSVSPSSLGDGSCSPHRNSGTSTPTRMTHQTNSQIHALRSEVIDGIEEIKDEISQVDDQIAALAEAQIRPGDHIVVHQPSSTVERFVLRAAAKRKFTVLIVTEANWKPDHGVQYASFRKKLTSLGTTVINVMNSGLMAYMSQVSKVVLGVRTIVANGGAVTDAGAAAIARAAQKQGTAVVVLAGVYKLSPVNPFDEDSLIEWGDSSSCVSFADGSMVNSVEIRSAVTELVPAQYIDTYITNLGIHSRDHLASLISDHYKQEDADFHLGDSADR